MMVKLLILLLFGSLVQLGIILIANPLHVNKRANIWFGLFLFIWASFWLDEIILMIGGETIGWRYAFLLSFIQYLSPLIFYVSIKFFTNPDYKFGTKGLFYLILPSFYLFFLTLDKMLAKDFKIILIALLLFHAIAYTIMSLFLIRAHKRHIQQFASNTLEIDLRWLEYIVWSTLFLVVAISIFNLLFFEAPLNFFMNAFVYVVILFTAYHSLKQKEIFPVDYAERAEALSILTESESEVVQNKIISDDRLVEMKAQLNDLITLEELYLDSELTLGKLAKKLNLTSHQLSYLINNGYNQNFYGYINKFRVEKSKKLLKDKELDKYSIIGIAFESGFNSKTAFNTAFKKITGQTPSEFKKRSSDL
ncbi:MAG: helix-turn-helix domain-containing protein [Bacteroidales bacterium]|nr:helix-turn-helix domain-containing protein [Bacteroidales bacterium]